MTITKPERTEKRCCCFRILGDTLRLEGPARLVEPVAAAYRRFTVEAAAPNAVGLEIVDSDPPGLLENGKKVELVRGLDLHGQVYRHFAGLVLDRADRHAVLHAGALVGPRGALVLAGPTGNGKSALTLELLSRGYRFLADDYAPLELAHSTIAPFPRALAITPDGEAPVPEVARRRARSAGTPRLFGKALLDPGDLFGEDCLASEDAPLAHVILLTPDDPARDPTRRDIRIDLILRAAEAGRIERQLTALGGVKLSTRVRISDLTRLDVEVTSAGAPLSKLTELLEDDGVVYCEKTWGPRPDFAGKPAAAPIPRRMAATLLGREMLNRRAGGRLMQRLDGSLPRLFLELGHALRKADCRQLRVGRLEATADLVERVVGSRS